MIATIRVLGLRPATADAVRVAARRVVAYVQGTQAQPAANDIAGYYTGSPRNGESAGVIGRARGSAAALVGLRGAVAGPQLERLLAGRHAVTSRPLLPAAGSAGRADRMSGPAVLAEVVTLEQAARAVGVSARYLRRLAAPHEAEAGWDSPEGDRSKSGERRPERPTEGDRLAAFREPGSGRWLVRREEVLRFAAARVPPTVVIGYDLVCSVPKSVSLLWAFADPQLRRDIAAAVDAAVDATIGYLERHAAVGTVDGRNRVGLGLAVASYRHEVSRSDEAHLHLHNVIVNAIAVPVLDEDGQPVLDERGVARTVWRALDGEVLLQEVKTAGYVGAAVLRRELSVRRGLSWGPVRNGVAEVAGFPPEVLAAFSSRREQLLEEFAQLVHAGFTPDAATLAAAQRASRAPKRVLADEQVHAIQASRLQAAGWTPDRVRAAAAHRDRRPPPPQQAEITALYDLLTGPAGLTEKQPVFGRREVVQAVAGWAGDRLDAEQIDALASRLLADPRIVLLSTDGRRHRSQPEPVYTTVDLLDTEQRLLAACHHGRTSQPRQLAAPVPPRLVEAAISAIGADLPAGLSREQADLVRRILGSGDTVRLVVGPAGTGKTEALRAVVHALTAAGHRPFGAAHGGRQAEELHHRVRITTRVVAGWLTLLDHTPDPTAVWPAGTVLLVDEASQVSTRDAERLLHHAAATGAVVVLVGDPAQLGSVGAGGWFTHLVTTTPGLPELAENQRQRGPALAGVRAALADLRTTDPDRHRQALTQLAADGRLRTLGGRSEILAAAVTDWYTDRRTTPADTGLVDRPRMMAERHADVELLNHAARTLLRADGTLTGPVLSAAGRDYQAGDEVITLSQAGHTLIPAGHPPAAYIRTGSIGAIAAVHPTQRALTVAFPGKGIVHIDWTYLTHPFPDGRNGGLGHAYALTAHKAEGATLRTARALAVDDTSRPGLYVMLSRARHDLRGYLIRRHHLTGHPADDETWLPALDDTTDPLIRLADHLHHRDTDRLATTHNPHAAAAHRLRAGATLAQLTRLRATIHNRQTGSVRLVDIRHAELAVEAAIAAAAVSNPPTRLLDRIGPRPHNGPDRAVWDTTVAALATYHARWHPTAPADDPGPQPTTAAAEDHHAIRWHRYRRLAEDLADHWAAQLDPASQRRYHRAADAIPRDRAIAGLHAILDHGLTPDTLTARLTRRDIGHLRSPAAVLDHRVTELLTHHRLDPRAYHLPPPRTRHEDWQHTTRLLHAAAANHLARQPTQRLHAERHHLTRRLTSSGPVEAAVTRARLELLHAALARQLDHTAVHLATQPADYLTALLGQRPADPERAATWDSHALAIEHYRHHTLGLPHRTDADHPDAPPSRRALGPAQPDTAGRRRAQLAELQTTLDTGVDL